jgi:hypothetical protein
VITAERLQTLISFTPVALARGLEIQGHRAQEFDSAEFVGITNGGQFCYRVTYYDEDLAENTHGKVFLTYDSAMGSVRVDY